MASKALTCVLLLLGASLAGCASTRDKNGATGADTGASAYSEPATSGVQLDVAGGLPAGVDSAVIYFAFDSDVIDAAGKRTVEGWARYLAANTGAVVRLEGHADERGTPEYNQGLGERRAIAVRRALLNLGVAANQLSTISYGETRPVQQGHSESAWSQNRRVEVAR